MPRDKPALLWELLWAIPEGSPRLTGSALDQEVFGKMGDQVSGRGLVKWGAPIFSPSINREMLAELLGRGGCWSRAHPGQQRCLSDPPCQ